jgi:hypothetical protein
VRAEQSAAGIETRADGVLIEKALALLASGARPTDVIAEAVLGLRGNPRTAALAVFTLLGSDARFRWTRPACGRS